MNICAAGGHAARALKPITEHCIQIVFYGSIGLKLFQLRKKNNSDYLYFSNLMKKKSCLYGKATFSTADLQASALSPFARKKVDRGGNFGRNAQFCHEITSRDNDTRIFNQKLGIFRFVNQNLWI